MHPWNMQVLHIFMLQTYRIGFPNAQLFLRLDSLFTGGLRIDLVGEGSSCIDKLFEAVVQAFGWFRS